MLRRRTLIVLGVALSMVVVMAGYKGRSAYRQLQQFSVPAAPLSVAVAAVTQRPWQPVSEPGDPAASRSHKSPLAMASMHPPPSPQTVVPESAVAYTLSGDWVYVVIHKTDSKDQPLLVAERRYIETGEHREGLVVVSKGLDAGDRVVIAGQLKLTPGAIVSITASQTLHLGSGNAPSLD
jgi:hypothetical protein